MGTTVRHLRRSVQKTAKKSRLSSDETKLAADCVIGICKSGSCKVSDIVRSLNHKIPLLSKTAQISPKPSRGY